MRRGSRRGRSWRSTTHGRARRHESLATAGLLKQAGLDAVHWSAIGPANAPDLAILAHAKTHNYVVLTHDLDHSAILAATNADKPSVAQIRSGDLTPETIAPPI